MWIMYEVSQVRPPYNGLTMGWGHPYSFFGEAEFGVSDCVWIIPGTVAPNE